MGRVAGLVLLAAVWLVLILVYPLLMLMISAGIFVFLAVLRQFNFYKIAMMVKRLIRDPSKLRYTLRARLKLGFRDSRHGSLDAEDELRQRTRGYM